MIRQFFIYLYGFKRYNFQMKKIIYSIFVFMLAFVSCGDDDKISSERTVRYIDLSDLTVYKGSPNGGEKIIYNDLKNRIQANYFFRNQFTPEQYQFYSIEFNKDRLTYVWGVSEGNQNKIVSTYTFENGKLSILNADTLRLVAYGDDLNNLYLRKSLARYPLPGQDKDTIQVFDVTIGMDTILKLAGHQSIDDLKLEGDTIVWCNMKYIFN